MSHASTRASIALLPVSDRYASLPVADAFTWAACADEVGPGEWYMVAFRSIRRPGVDEARLTDVRRLGARRGDACAGLRPLLQGTARPRTGSACRSACGTAGPRPARRPADRPTCQAAALTHEAYAAYTLEFHRVRRLDGDGGFTFEPYDASPGKRDRDRAREGSRRSSPRPEPAARRVGLRRASGRDAAG